MHTVPNKIAFLRKQKKYSQAKLAQKMNISIAQLSRLERGISSMSQGRMVQIARALEVKPVELYFQAPSQGRIELKIVHAVVLQIDEMVERLGITLNPKQRADLTIELYRQEVARLDGSVDQTVDLKLYENIVLALRG